MSEGADPESKTEEATPRKLEDARKKGDVAKSPDVASTLSLAGASAAVLMTGGYFATSMAEQLLPFIAAPHTMLGGLEAGAGVEIGAIALWAVAPFLGVVMLATILGGVGGNVAQSGLIFSADKLKPDWSKVSPMKGFKRIFGPDGLVQFIKTFIKLLAVGFICWMVLKPRLRDLENMAAMPPAMILPVARDMILALVVATLILLAFTAGADFLWQKFRFAERMKMTKEEIKEDYKQSEGDPHVKAKLKQIRAQRSRQRMMQNVPKATVIITNPTHYSVALRYEPGEGDPAPICVAKGVDALALRIREVAREHQVPIVENVPLARALYAAVEVDQTIPREHFEAAARVIGFVMQKRKKR
ncbi:MULTISPECIES: flagellar biosynthesis protein FlhB [unclassified Brevundimonas]|uniref:flagellar biosynthesis protein FlhB n=1 Tax=unclassified Brevundimonas TaxID=2622653 RepID=UPI000701A653|nr:MULTISPECIES: flagellar biosynthesis protein FlhB [unclassified Brevundimonas]KQY83578.1 flagellar biosynthetic protein FlhB [Brevundimonas sp. Root1423]KRA26398.1 flagellar biosynthetic protein FlhB [Brevundimonas sp. Root608]